MKTISIIPTFGDKGLNVEAIQMKLTELGYNLGNIDGSFGGQTKKAISEFQSSQNLKDDGIITPETLSLIGLQVETELSSNPYIAIPSIVDKTRITKTRWENGNRGQAPYGYYYGMALMFANLYDRLKKGDKVAQELAKPLGDSRDKDALKRFEDILRRETSNQLNTETDRLRGLFVLMFGLGLMESNGKHCCGWDRGKTKGWGNPAKIKEPTSTNSEAGLFQTSYDIISSVNTATKNLLIEIFNKYKLSQEGYLELFSKGVKCKERDLENYGNGDGKEFQKLSKECPGFTVEFTALALRNIATHWNPVIKINDSDKGLQIKKECDSLLKEIQNYLDNNRELNPLVTEPQAIIPAERNLLKQTALELAQTIGQRQQLEELFQFGENNGSKANFWAIVDFNKPRTEKRLFIFDLKNKTFKSYHVSHGKNSGDLYATDFSNDIGSNKSCLGIFKTGTTYIGKNGRSLYIDGLQDSNNNTRERYIVIHQGRYVSNVNAGHSLGCFVVSSEHIKEVIDNLRDGSYLKAWHS